MAGRGIAHAGRLRGLHAARASGIQSHPATARRTHEHVLHAAGQPVSAGTDGGGLCRAEGRGADRGCEKQALLRLRLLRRPAPALRAAGSVQPLVRPRRDGQPHQGRPGSRPHGRADRLDEPRHLGGRDERFPRPERKVPLLRRNFIYRRLCGKDSRCRGSAGRRGRHAHLLLFRPRRPYGRPPRVAEGELL